MFNDPYLNVRQMSSTSPELMRTYQMTQPLDTHYRVATCQEVDCSSYANGWKMGFDLHDDDRAAAARWIRDKSGYAFTYELTPDERRVIFTFAAGQQCFQTHRVFLERDPFMMIRGGSLGRWTGVKQAFTNPMSFLDSWATDLDKLNDRREQG